MNDFYVIFCIVIFLLHLYTIIYSFLHFGFIKNISNKKNNHDLIFVKDFCIIGNFIISSIYNFYFYYSDKYFVKGRNVFFNTSLFNVFLYFLILIITLFTQNINPILNENILCIWSFYIILNLCNIMIGIINFRIKEYMLLHNFRSIIPYLLEHPYRNELISDNMTEICTDPGDDIADETID